MTTRSRVLIAGVALIGLAAAGFAATGTAHERSGGVHKKYHGTHHAYAGKRHHGMDRHGKRHGHRMMRFFMERHDADGDKRVTLEEIETVRTDRVGEFDSDGDGRLSLEEYEALWLDQMRRRMVRSFQRYDVDGDAQVTQEEYVDPVLKRAERFDRNRDGAIDRDDRRRHHKRGKTERPQKPADETDNSRT